MSYISEVKNKKNLFVCANILLLNIVFLITVFFFFFKVLLFINLDKKLKHFNKGKTLLDVFLFAIRFFGPNGQVGMHHTNNGQ